MVVASTYFGVPEIADRLRVKVDKVLSWIHSGELRAINVSQKSGCKPRWRISEDDLAAFLEARTSRGIKASQPACRRRRKKSAETVRHFIK